MERIGSIFYFVLTCIYGIIVLTPISAEIMHPFVLPVFVALWLVLALLFTGDKTKFKSLLLVYFLLLTFLLVGYKNIGYSSAQWGTVFTQICFYSTFLLFFLYRKHLLCLNDKLFAVIVVCIILNLISNIYIGNIYEDISSMMYDETYRENMEGKLNVGGTPFNTFMLLVYFICVFMFLNDRRKKVRLIMLLVASLDVYYLLFYGHRGSIVTTLVFFTILFPIFRLSTVSKTKKYISLILLLIIGLFVYIFYDDILNWVISISSDRLAYRFEDLKSSTKSGISEDSFSGRLGLALMSLGTFFRSVISIFFGIGDHRWEDVGWNAIKTIGIGGHSQICDTLARYGLLGATLIYGLFASFYRELKKMTGSPYIQKQVKIIFIFFIFLSLTKETFLPDIGFVILVFFPCAIMFLQEKPRSINNKIIR